MGGRPEIAFAFAFFGSEHSPRYSFPPGAVALWIEISEKLRQSGMAPRSECDFIVSAFQFNSVWLIFCPFLDLSQKKKVQYSVGRLTDKGSESRGSIFPLNVKPTGPQRFESIAFSLLEGLPQTVFGCSL